MYYTNDGVVLYLGDKITGDREATTEEVAVYETNRAEMLKPNRCTKLQMQKAMRELLIWDDFKLMRAANIELEDYWSDALDVYRFDPMVLSMGKTDAELDALFLLASTK